MVEFNRGAGWYILPPFSFFSFDGPIYKLNYSLLIVLFELTPWNSRDVCSIPVQSKFSGKNLYSLHIGFKDRLGHDCAYQKVIN